MERDEATLLDIARAARFVLEFKAGLDKAAFFDDFKTQSAVLHQLMVTTQAPPEVQGIKGLPSRAS
jgi:uncharacterized protein with HEPN domain